VPGVAPLGLDASYGEHGFSGDIDHVAPEPEGEHGAFGESEAARADEDDLVCEIVLCEDLVDTREPDLEWECDMVGEDERAGAGAALAAVDGDEVDGAIGGFHLVGKVHPEVEFADGGFDADGEPGALGDGFDKVEEGVGVEECAVARGGDAVFALGDASDLGDLGGDFGGGEDASDPGLGALGEFDLDGADLGLITLFNEPIERELAIGISASEVARADLPDEIAAGVVVGGDAALAGVLHGAGDGDPAVDGFDSGPRERSETHGGGVDDGVWSECLGAVAVGTEDLGAGDGVEVTRADLAFERIWEWHCLVLEDDVARGVIEVVVGAEPEVVVLLFGRCVDPSALVAGERSFFVVGGDDILAEFWADGFEPVAEMADDGEVFEDGVLGLELVVDDDGDEDEDQCCRDDEPDHGRFSVGELSEHITN